VPIEAIPHVSGHSFERAANRKCAGRFRPAWKFGAAPAQVAEHGGIEQIHQHRVETITTSQQVERRRRAVRGQLHFLPSRAFFFPRDSRTMGSFLVFSTALPKVSSIEAQRAGPLRTRIDPGELRRQPGTSAGKRIR
jgi:hypothetical protein